MKARARPRGKTNSFASHESLALAGASSALGRTCARPVEKIPPKCPTRRSAPVECGPLSDRLHRRPARLAFSKIAAIETVGVDQSCASEGPLLKRRFSGRLISQHEHRILDHRMRLLAIAVAAADATVVIDPVGHKAVAIDPGERFPRCAADESERQPHRDGHDF
jgi:hypothetical protein